MCLLLETIRIRDGQYCYPAYHQARMDRSRRALFGKTEPIRLEAIPLPDRLPPGEIRCRLVYGHRVERLEFLPYKRKDVRSMVLAEAGELIYPYKFLDRSAIERIRQKYNGFDDIILVKNGLITDSSYSNLAFLSAGIWYTPTEPMLAGTCRQRLIDTGQIREREIRPADLHLYSCVSLINAMLDLGDISIPANAIYSADAF